MDINILTVVIIVVFEIIMLYLVLKKQEYKPARHYERQQEIEREIERDLEERKNWKPARNRLFVTRDIKEILERKE